MLADYSETHQGGVDFVRDIFLGMGGSLVPAPPPRRPEHRDCGYKIESVLEAFYMDFENSCLSDFGGEHPRGPNRWEHRAWAAHIKAQVFPYHSDVDWEEYVEWVSGGGGDEVFQEGEDEL